MQTNIFEFMYPKFKIDKKIRTIELFAGYGSTHLAWKYLGIPVESHRICEWAVKSIQAYKDLHCGDDNKDYSEGIDIETIKTRLFEWGISSNYNEPMTRKQVNRLSEKEARKIFNNIIATKNLVNIQQVKGKDLAIVEKDIYIYIFSYSFPCQDLSNAGKKAGMSDTSTRSGMLWEVERILTELSEKNALPQVLLMENVPLVHGSDNVKDFNRWQLRLEELGYKNYWQDLMATDYGIPQIRNRCFMVSILGDYSYTFPEKQPLKRKLKDLLENDVDPKYTVSKRRMKSFTKEMCGKFPRKLRFTQSLKMTNENNLAGTLTTNEGNVPTSNFIRIKNKTKKGYLEAHEGDGVDISSRMEHHRGTVQPGKAQTIMTTQVGGGSDER